jgi:hypothetical protein
MEAYHESTAAQQAPPVSCAKPPISAGPRFVIACAEPDRSAKLTTEIAADLRRRVAIEMKLSPGERGHFAEMYEALAEMIAAGASDAAIVVHFDAMRRSHSRAFAALTCEIHAKAIAARRPHKVDVDVSIERLRVLAARARARRVRRIGSPRRAPLATPLRGSGRRQRAPRRARRAAHSTRHVAAGPGADPDPAAAVASPVSPALLGGAAW